MVISKGIFKHGFFLGALFFISVGYADDLSLEAIKKRIAPIGQINIEGEKPVFLDSKANLPIEPIQPARSGQQIYLTACVLCHGSGLVESPKLGDRVAWAPRIKQGFGVLVEHAMQGYRFMPAKGNCLQCTDEEIKAAIKFMVDKVS